MYLNDAIHDLYAQSQSHTWERELDHLLLPQIKGMSNMTRKIAIVSDLN